jgi:hypothetical protein
MKPQTSNLKHIALWASLPYPDKQTLEEHLNSFDNWDELIRSLQSEKTLPLFHQNLKDLGITHLIPESKLTNIKNILRRQAMRQLNKSSVFAEMARLLKQNQVSFIPIKGITLLNRVYGNPALRPMLDIDLLVKPDDTKRISRLMKDQGAHQHTGLQSKFLDSFLQHIPAITWKNTLFEFHTSFFGKTDPFSLSTGQAWKNSQPYTLFNQKIQMLSPETELVYLTLHAYKHLVRKSFRLVWLNDVILYLKRMEFSPDKALSLLQNDSDKKAFYSMMGLAASLNQATLPPQFTKELKEYRTEEVRKALDEHLQEQKVSPGQALFSDLGKLNTKTKVRYIAAILVPSPAFIRKKYNTKSLLLMVALYPYHTFRKMMEGMYYLLKQTFFLYLY